MSSLGTKIDILRSSFDNEEDLMYMVNGEPNRWGSVHYQTRCFIDHFVHIGDISPLEAKEIINELRRTVINSLNRGDYPFHGWLYKMLTTGSGLEKRNERIINALVTILYCHTIEEFITDVLNQPELLVNS